jgi:hypothetical protein
MIAPDPFKTEKPISSRGMDAFETIESRLSLLSPGISIKEYIALNNQPGKTGFSSLEIHEGTLDGINFRTDNPERLANAFYNAKDICGKQAFASMKEDPDHWALKAFFGKTIGTGWREIWRPKFYKATTMPEKASLTNNPMKMRFGSAGIPFIFSALHCSVDKRTGDCNIHIDESGFVMGLPNGVALTPDMYQHTINELLFKTEFRDWLSGKISNQRIASIVSDVIRRVSITFPNAFNGYAGLDKTINSFRRPTSIQSSVTGALWGAARILKPIGMSVDIFDNEKFNVQVNLTQVNGEFSATFTVGGSF